MLTSSPSVLSASLDLIRYDSVLYSSHLMTATMTRGYDILNRTFEYDELQDIARYGAVAGVNGFIYSSELYDVWVNHGEDIASYLDEFADACFGKSWEAMILSNPNIDSDYWTTQQLREWAIWSYLELRAQEITAEDFEG